jgi:hypothetical protein
LTRAALGGRRQRIVGDAAADRDEPAQALPVRVCFHFRLAQQRVGVGAENAKRQRIFENRRTVQHLMRGAKPGGAERGAAWLSRLHGDGMDPDSRCPWWGPGVIAGLDPAIHPLRKTPCEDGWIRGSSPRMTKKIPAASGRELMSNFFFFEN